MPDSDRRRSPRDIRTIPRRAAMIAVGCVLALTADFEFRPRLHAESPAATPTRRPIRREASDTSGGRRAEGSSSGGWWLGTVGVALGLAACGWASLAARRFLPKASGNAPSVRVIGRTSLSPKHSVYLLDVAGRVLIVGTGPQGAPSLLGEMLGDELPESGPASSPRRLDIRVGDDT